MYYSCPSPPICLEALSSYDKIKSTIKVGCKTLPSHSGIRPQQQPKDLYAKPKTCGENVWQLSIKVRMRDAYLSLWILAKVTTRFMESMYYFNISVIGNDLGKNLEIFA